MKAIIHTRFGPPDVMHLAEVEKPLPKDNQVCVKAFASTVNSGDVKMRSFKNIPWTMALLARPMFGFRTPRQPILGLDFAGEVDCVGSNVTQFKAGDKVFGMTDMNMGANAEYVCVSGTGTIAHLPEGHSYQEMAATTFGALTALHFLKAGKIAKGDNVLINGASGAVGVAAIQIAKHFGATVTGICSTKNMELVQSLGADHVIDYTKQDIMQCNQPYDLIFDTMGKFTFGKAKRILKPNGRYLQAVFAIRHLFQMLLVNVLSQRKMICTVAGDSLEDLRTLKSLIENKQYKAVIDRTYPLEETAKAHAYVDQGHKVGSVVIVIDGHEN